MKRSMIMLALAVLCGSAGARGQVIEWDVNASGGEEMTGGGFYMNGTVSQTADILTTAGGLEIGEGFWYRAGARSQLATTVAGIDWYVIAGGGDQDAMNALFRINGTVSQTASELVSGGGFEIGQGFWYGEPDIPLYKIHEDDNDGVVTGGGAAGQLTAAARATMAIAPNPVAGYAKIQVRIPQAADVRIEIYDAAGSSVGNAFAGSLAAGDAEVYFDGSHMPAGTYFVRMDAGNDVITKKITIVR